MNKQQAITVRIKNVYGKELIYPADLAAQTFLKLTGKRTFDMYDIRNIKQLGFDVQVEQETL